MSDPNRSESVDDDNANAGISRRRFSATLAAGGVYTAVHQLLGVAATSVQAPRRLGRSELCQMSAVELAARLARKQVSAREVMTAHLAQIERLNPKVNAIVTLVAEQAMAGAAKADEAIVGVGPRRPSLGHPFPRHFSASLAGSLLQPAFGRVPCAPIFRTSSGPLSTSEKRTRQN